MNILQNTRKLISILGVGLLLTGCSDNNQVSQQPSSEPETTRTLSHAMGDSLIPESPKRIVVLSVEGTETLLALGITPIGAVRSYTSDPSQKWFTHIREQMKDVAVIGKENQVNLEAIASLKPDLILGLKTRQEPIYPQLSAIAPTVFANQFGGALRENLLLFSDAVNRKQEGQQLLKDLDTQISTLSGKLDQQGWLEQEAAVIRFQVTGARYYYNDSFAAGLISELGFARPPLHDTDGFAESLTRERIPEADADIQFYFTFATSNPDKGLKNTNTWLNDPLWQSLRASRKQQVYEVNNDIWNKSYGIISGQLVLQDIESLLLEG